MINLVTTQTSLSWLGCWAFIARPFCRSTFCYFRSWWKGLITIIGKMMRMLILATKVKELEEEIREKAAEEEEEVEEGPVATILANMKRTISNADALRWRVIRVVSPLCLLHFLFSTVFMGLLYQGPAVSLGGATTAHISRLTGLWSRSFFISGGRGGLIFEYWQCAWHDSESLFKYVVHKMKKLFESLISLIVISLIQKKLLQLVYQPSDLKRKRKLFYI